MREHAETDLYHKYDSTGLQHYLNVNYTRVVRIH